MGGAAVPEPSGKGKKKALDAVVNVVPFIDLLSCCLSFLLITAVWTQVAKLQVSQSGGPNDSPPPSDKTLQLSLTITDKGYALSAGQGGNVVDVPKKGTDYDVGGSLRQAQGDQEPVSRPADHHGGRRGQRRSTTTSFRPSTPASRPDWLPSPSKP